MFSSHQESIHYSEGRIIFPLCRDKETFDRRFYHPSLTANQLSTEEVNRTLSQVDQIYRQKEEHIFRTVFFSTLGFVFFQACAHEWRASIPYFLRKPLYRGINTFIFASTGLYIWNHNKKSKKQASELLERANERTVPKGFR